MPDSFEELYAAKRALLEVEAAVLDADDESQLAEKCRVEVDAAVDLFSRDRSESSFRAMTLAELLPKVEHAAAVEALFCLLNMPEQAVRRRAADGLEVVATRRLNTVVRGAEEWIASGVSGPALRELPSILFAIVEPGDTAALGVLINLLEHANPDVVAEAACALAEVHDPGIEQLLEGLTEDPRSLSDSPGTVGELVTELLASIRLGDALAKRTPAKA